MKALLLAADPGADARYVKSAKGYVVDALAWHVKGACGATLVGDTMLLAALNTKASMVVSQMFMGVSVELLDEVSLYHMRKLLSSAFMAFGAAANKSLRCGG